jgi:hypothetical protein
MLIPQLLVMLTKSAVVTPAKSDNAGVVIDLPEIGLVSPGTIQGGDAGGLH